MSLVIVAFILSALGLGTPPTTTATPSVAATTPTRRDQPHTETIPQPAPTTPPRRNPQPPPAPTRTPTRVPTVRGGTALAQLDTLAVKGRAPTTGYDRAAFAWRRDTDRNGCDTRNDVLRRDLNNLVVKAHTRGCVAVVGDLLDPYSNATIHFTKTRANTVDIDHVVALSNAWQTGAQALSTDQRVAFANDPLNLVAVNAVLNRQKGDGDAATWLPPHKPYRCTYIARQIAVKAKYRMWVTPPENAAMRRILATCPTQAAASTAVTWPAPEHGNHPRTKQPTTPAPAKPPRRNPQPPPSHRPPADATYANCAEARAAGAAPLYRGQPGYSPNLDRDGDGIACE